MDSSENSCAFSPNYDVDKIKGTCSIGFTSNVQLSICRSKAQKFTCPKDYVIYIVSAEYAVTSDGSCDYR